MAFAADRRDPNDAGRAKSERGGGVMIELLQAGAPDPSATLMGRYVYSYVLQYERNISYLFKICWSTWRQTFPALGL